MAKQRFSARFDTSHYPVQKYRNAWSASRDYDKTIIPAGRDTTEPFPKILAKYRHDTFSRMFSIRLNALCDSINGKKNRSPLRLEAVRDIEHRELFRNECEFLVRRLNRFPGLHDRIRFAEFSDALPSSVRIFGCFRDRHYNIFDCEKNTERIYPRIVWPCVYSTSKANIRMPVSNRFDSVSSFHSTKRASRFDCFPSLLLRWHGRLDVDIRLEDISIGRFLSHSLTQIVRHRAVKMRSKWESSEPLHGVRKNLLFDASDCLYEIHDDRIPLRFQAFVRPGWRIIAKNIESGETFDLGFVDADTENAALEDVFLPDGDYEISVLTSSLFWNDCIDRNIRTISIRPGEEVTSLPTIYHLRSAVLDGVTTIRWSANRSELDDCVFGVWYSSESPVDVNRPPDQTIWYFSSQTEYATTFNQNAPAWVAVAAMRTGNEPETGKVHELQLDWSNVPPRRPDDVMVLNAPLAVFNTEIETRHEDDPFMTLWNG